MGEIINVRCMACNQEWQCYTGSGLLHGKKENIIAAFSKGRRQQAESMIAASEIPAYDFQYRLAVCGHCQKIVAVPVLRIADCEEVCVGLCPFCEGETTQLCREEQGVLEWSRKTSCPICNSSALLTEDGGYWD